MTSSKLLLLLGVAMTAPAGAAVAQTTTPAPATTPAPRAAPAQTPARTSATPAPAAQTPATPEGQTPAKPAEGEQPSTVGDVVVTAQASPIRTSIDSVSYSLKDDLQATTGSLADALRNVPSVDVDPQGNVSLRGDGNVTILVDGQPSGILTGEARAQALLQLPADRYARIEVMTNPSAAYSPEGSGGVINLITKPTTARPDALTTGSVRANVGDNGRWNLGVSGSWQKDKLTLSGDLSYRVDPNEFSFNRVREQLDPTTGAVVSTTRVDQDVFSDQTGSIGRFSLEYKLTPKSQITAELRGVVFEGGGGVDSLYETRNAAGTVTSAYTRDGESDFTFQNWGATGRLLHRFDDAGHEWSNELRFDRNATDASGLGINVFSVPALPTYYEWTKQDQKQVTLGFTSAYVRPTKDGGKLRLGYEFNQQRPDQEVTLLRGSSVSTLTPVAGQNNRFEARQTVHALYATWEKPLTAKLSGQAGLRLEQADIEIEDLTGGASASQDYFKAYPTAHLQYLLSETQTLRASYSRRIQRPQPAQLNPFVAYQDPLNVRSGNPDLAPQETDSFEAMWQVRKGQSFYMATAYLRDTDKAFTEVATDIGGGVLLTRPENLGSRRDMGLELTAAGPLTPTLRYNASINAFHQEIDADGIPGGGDREGEFISGRASLSWQVTPKDFVQLTGFWQGESLLAQGTREAGGMVNLGYRRKLTDSVSFNFTGRDILNSFNNTTTYNTPLFREVSEQNISLRAFYVGLTWTFGTSPRKPPEQFDFSTGPTGG